MKLFNLAVGAFALVPLVTAQYPPKPSGLTNTISTVNQQINITWKEVSRLVVTVYSVLTVPRQTSAKPLPESSRTAVVDLIEKG